MPGLNCCFIRAQFPVVIPGSSVQTSWVSKDVSDGTSYICSHLCVTLKLTSSRYFCFKTVTMIFVQWKVQSWDFGPKEKLVFLIHPQCSDPVPICLIEIWAHFWQESDLSPLTNNCLVSPLMNSSLSSVQSSMEYSKHVFVLVCLIKQTNQTKKFF